MQLIHLAATTISMKYANAFTSRFSVATILLLAAFSWLSTVQAFQGPLSDTPDAKLKTPRFFALSTQTGLSQDSVVDMLLDSDGFLYLGTEGGLDRWDGYNLKRINGPNDELLDMPVYRIVEDSRKNIWLATVGDGIYRLTPSTGELVRVVALPYVDYEDYIQIGANMFEDAQSRIIIVLEQTILRYDYATESTEVIYEINDQLIESENFIRWAINLDNWLLIATSNGLYAKKENQPAIKLNFLGGPNDANTNFDKLNVKHLFIDSQDYLWISTVRGLYRSSTTDLLRSLEETGSMQPAQLVIPERNIWRVIEKAPEQFWIGSDIGLYSLDMRDESPVYEYLFEPLKGVDVLSRKDIKDIEIDRDGNLWLATNYGGALYWSPLSLTFDTLSITLENKNNAPLTDNTIWAIHEDPDNDLWIGTDNGLTVYSPATGESKLLFQKSEYIPYSDAYVDRIFTVEKDRAIVQTGFGLWEVDKTTGERKIVETLSDDDKSVVSSYVWGSGQDAEKRIWFVLDTGNRTGYFIYDPFDKSLTELPLGDNIPVNRFYAFLDYAEEFDNQMWLATTGELSLIHPQTYARTTVHKIPPAANNARIYPSSVTVDQSGIIWIGYPGHGLYGVDKNTFEQRYFFNEDNLLPTNLVYSLMTDAEDNLWFSSHSGLHRLSADRQGLEDFRYGQELNVAEFNDHAHTKLRDGSLAFGSPSGVVSFDPASLIEASYSETAYAAAAQQDKMVISEVSLATRELDMPLNNIAGETIKLNYDDNGLTIRFSSLQFSQSGLGRYTYTLIKNGKSISTASTNEPFVSLPLLEEGDYTFTVAPSDNSTLSNMQPASLQISVAPAPWNTLAAKVLYALAIGLVLLLVWWIRKGQKFHLEQARNQVRLFGDAFKQTRDWVVIFSQDYQPIAVNPAFENAFALDPDEDVAQQFKTLQAKYPELMSYTQSALQQLNIDGFWRSEQKLQLADGRQHDVLINLNAVKNGDDASQIDHYLMVFSDISEQKQAERKLLKMATYDGLTGLVNRNLLLDRLEHAIDNAKRHNSLVAVLFVDLDRFKGINDSLGHEYGDNILRVVAKRMQNITNQNDTVGRIGGDEFVIVLEDVKDFEDVSSFISNLIELIEEPIQVRKETLRVSCSIGVSVYPNDGTEPSDLLRYADVAMYSAKGDAVNSFRFFTESMNVRAKYRLSLENLVKRAYQQELFFNVYQPIVNINTHQTEGMELLMRCAISEQPISPAEFVPILEEMRLIVEVTRLSIIAGIKELATWYEEGYRGYLSVNLSALHFTATFDLEILAELLDRYQLPRSALRFEVTEGVLMGDKEMALEQFKALNAEGYLLALDDFGTGYSSLSYLKIFPLDVIKIDKSFTDDIGTGSSGDSLIITTIGMAKNLHMDCIAEGIETEEQVSFLAEHGCFRLQGYYFSKPVTADMAKSIVVKQWQELYSSAMN
ncbi:EAL domain-containing protein [Alteromonas flava]|uniref:EAL domain-containing protein n=1 Tax=Alteromonas flava TaxID=2048003 RepID=UPI000C2904B8|nr:EAL domain-containing protein [Alteromonas flava]